VTDRHPIGDGNHALLPFCHYRLREMGINAGSPWCQGRPQGKMNTRGGAAYGQGSSYIGVRPDPASLIQTTHDRDSRKSGDFGGGRTLRVGGERGKISDPQS
jgi:hypothetical protein